VLKPRGSLPEDSDRREVAEVLLQGASNLFLFEQGLCQKGRKFNNLFKLHGYLNRSNSQGIYFVEIILEKVDTKYALRVSIWVESIQA
jgi:hypothetical protein